MNNRIKGVQNTYSCAAKKLFNMDWKHLIATIFLTVWIPSCYAADPRDICPPEELVTPCRCRQHFEDNRAIVVCEGVNINDVVMDVLNKTSEYGYEYFMIDLASLNYMRAESFQIKKLKRLIIMDTTMITLFDEAPKTEDLQGFTAYGLKLSRAIQWDLFAGITNLQNLTIENSPLKSVDAQFVEYAPKTLVRIILSNCSISKVHEEAYKDLTELQELTMNTGKIKELKRSMFPSPAKIELFSFKNQRIESIPDDLFTDFPRLRDLLLDGNLISTISETTYRPPFTQDSMRSFTIEQNPLKCNCGMKWLAVIQKTDRENRLWKNLIGTCEEPKNLHGKMLWDLIENDFEHCGN